MAASSSVPLNKKQRKAFIAYYDQLQNLQNVPRSNRRSRMETIDKQYQREEDETLEQQRAKAANKSADPTRFQNITVPVVAPQVEAATVYQTSVFLTGSPIFGVVSSPEYIDEALQMETVLEDNSIRGGWTRELMLFFRDGNKYNFAPIEVSWAQEVSSSVETVLDVSKDEGIPKELIWSGNKLRRLDGYNLIIDPRVAPTEVYKKGEFIGFTEYMTRIDLKAFIASLPDKIIAEVVPAFESGLQGSGSVASDSKNFYIPSINPEVDEDEGVGINAAFSWDAWAGIGANAKGQRIDYKDAYDVTTLYCRILPAEFGLVVPNSSTPQIYKLVIVNHQHIIYAERQTNAHNYLPILIGQPLEDGMGYQTKSLATNAAPFQYVATSYMNSILHSRRRAVTDRVLYDPSRITSAQINSDNPSAKIPVRPAAYGKDISQSVYQFPYREDQAGFSMSQVGQLIAMANGLAGQNQVSQGQFVKGNKTRDEFQETMQNANGRDQMASILIEAQTFVPMKLMFKLNILQFQGGTTIYNRDKQLAVEIDPVQLRKAVLEFRVSDGLIPSTKIVDGDTLTTALQVIGSSPQIANGYNIAPLFSYLMKVRGAKISEFEKSAEQLAYEQALGAWQQLATTTAEKGGDIEKLPSQPLPEQFNYNPAGNKPTPETGTTAEATGPRAGPQG